MPLDPLPGARAALRLVCGAALVLALIGLAPAAAAATSAPGTCTPATLDALDVGSNVNGGSATLVVPAGTCPVTVSFSSYGLPGGQKLPYEEQVLIDNVTAVYGPGTYHLTVEVPDCAYQTDLYVGPVLYPLGPRAHAGRVFDYNLRNLGDACGDLSEECANVDFEKGADGQRLHRGQVIDDEYGAFGVTFSSKDGEKLLVFDTGNPTGGDFDLRTPGPGTGNGTFLGNVLILSEDGDESDPDDDARGGTMVLSFASPVSVQSVDVLDIDHDEFARVRAYGAGGGLITEVSASALGNNSFETVAVGAEAVARLEVEFSSSGALAGLVFCDAGDICEADAGPPQIEYAFEGTNRVVITVTDDTGIASLDVDLQDTAGGTPNLVLVGSMPDLSGFPTEVTLTYELRNFVQNTFVRVNATDRCGQIQCPADGDGSFDEFPPQVQIRGADGSDPDSDPGDASTGFAFHPDGLQALPIFFNLQNTRLVSNEFADATRQRAEFFLETVDKGRGGTFGLIAASACNATVIDPEVGADGGSDEARPFLEADGLVVMEAEHATRVAGTGGASGHAWEDLGEYDGSSGSAVQAGPNAGYNTGEGLNGPRLDFEVTFETPGTYYLWARASANSTGDNSVHAGIDGEAATLGRLGLDFYWAGWTWTNKVHWRPGSDRVRVEVDAPGTRTVSVWMREDGVRLDRILLTTDRRFQPYGAGPDESARGAAGDALAAQEALMPLASLQAGEPLEFGLAQNYPNPFGAQTTVEFSLPEATDVRLALYNVLGQEVSVLAEGSFEAGRHRVALAAGDLASGTYVYRLSTPAETATRRLTVVR